MRAGTRNGKKPRTRISRSGKRATSATTILETRDGRFLSSFFETRSGDQCLVLRTRHIGKSKTAPIIRIQSACLFGEAFHSEECDCRQQLDASLELIASAGGVIIYLFQEGRGIGLCEKIVAMEIERVDGLNTAEAFAKLGYAQDIRTYVTAIEALKAIEMGSKLRVISNNPFKLKALEDGGYEIVERIE